MKDILRSQGEIATIYPAPHWRPLAWLVEGRSGVEEIAVGLRSTLFRRMSSLVAAAVVNLIIIVVSTVRHPEAAFVVWAVAGGTLIFARFAIIAIIGRETKRGSLSCRRGLVDLFVASSLLWSLQLGLGALLCLCSGDAALAPFAVVLTMGGTGAMSARNPGSPRLCGVQMMLVLVPFMLGSLLSPDTAGRFLALMMPPYLLGLLRVNDQLHNDYVDMLTAQHENRKRALHCGLTGLPNVTYFHQSLAAALGSSDGPSLAVLALDLDGFKAVNDRHGHPAGDALLQHVAQRIRHATDGSAAMGARIGGDEFAIVVRCHGPPTPEGLAERLIRDISMPYELNGATIRVGVSIGIAIRGERDQDSVSLYSRADQALYRAKAAGKGTWSRDAEAETVAGRVPASGDAGLRPAPPTAASEARGSVIALSRRSNMR